MGSYVLALVSKTLDVGGEVVGMMTFAYNPYPTHRGNIRDAERRNEAMERQTVGRREVAWRDRPLPAFWVYASKPGTFKDGMAVYRMPNAGKVGLAISVWDDEPRDEVGVLRSNGRGKGWRIERTVLPRPSMTGEALERIIGNDPDDPGFATA